MNARRIYRYVLFALGFLMTACFACIAPVVTALAASDAFRARSDEEQKIGVRTAEKERRMWQTCAGMAALWVLAHLFYRGQNPDHSEWRCFFSAYGSLVSIFFIMLLRDGFFRALAHRAGYGNHPERVRDAQ